MQNEDKVRAAAMSISKAGHGRWSVERRGLSVTIECESVDFREAAAVAAIEAGLTPSEFSVITKPPRENFTY